MKSYELLQESKVSKITFRIGAAIILTIITVISVNLFANNLDIHNSSAVKMYLLFIVPLLLLIILIYFKTIWTSTIRIFDNGLIAVNKSALISIFFPPKQPKIIYTYHKGARTKGYLFRIQFVKEATATNQNELKILLSAPATYNSNFLEKVQETESEITLQVNNANSCVQDIKLLQRKYKII